MSASEDSPRADARGGRRRRGSSRDSAFLAVGSAASGLLAYVFFALATRSLGAEDAAPISVLWTYWAMTAAVLTFPVQHWIIRRFTGDGHEGTVRRSLPAMTVAVVAIALVSGLVALVFRQELFRDESLVFPAMVAAITLGAFFSGVLRGALSGRGRFGATAGALAGENAWRVVAAGVVVWAGGGAQAFGFALVAGPLVGLAWVTSLRFGSAPAESTSRRSTLAFLSGIAGGSLVSQVVLTGTPLALALAGGAPTDVTSLFLALAVWRAPYIVALGVAPQLTTVLTGMVVEGPPRRVVRASRITVGVVVVAAAVAAGVGASVLAPLLRLVFGPDIQVSSANLAILGVGTAVALGNLVLLLILLVLGRSRAATIAWTAGLLAGIAWIIVSTAGAVSTVVFGFLLAELTALVLLLVRVETGVRQVASSCLDSAGDSPTTT